MSLSAATIAPPPGYAGVRADSAIQFAPVQSKLPKPQPQPQSPGWLEDFFRWLGELLEPLGRFLGGNATALQYVILAIGVAGLAFLIWLIVRDYLPESWQKLRRGKGLEDEGEWRPSQQEAEALLDEADRLAAEGRFDEAAHVLLHRAIGQIAGKRPDLLAPSSTAREITGLAALSARAQASFGIMARVVEKSLFAGLGLVRDEWLEARAAYADFALADIAINDRQQARLA